MKSETRNYYLVWIWLAILLAICATASEIRALNQTLVQIESDLACSLLESDESVFFSVAETPQADPDTEIAYTVDGVTITHYCACEKCCGKWANGITAYGDIPTPGVTVAAHPNFLSAGTRVEIGGHIYTVQDTGVSGRAIDVFCATHQEAVEKGIYQASINVLS